MKYLLFTIFASLNLVSCSPTSGEAQNIKNISVAEAKDLISKEANLQILDVRTPGEWSEGVIEGAIKINVHDADFMDKVAKLSKDKPTLVYCKRGSRSANAAGMMEGSGYTDLYNLLGGYDAYVSE